MQREFSTFQTIVAKICQAIKTTTWKNTVLFDAPIIMASEVLIMSWFIFIGSYLGVRSAHKCVLSCWFWPYARSDSIVEIQSWLPEVMLGDVDLPVWSSNNGVYSCASTWDHLRRKKPTIDWWKLVWNSLSIPRHSIFLWLVFKEAIVTKVRMCSWGMRETSFACSVGDVRKAKIIYFFSVASAEGSGFLWWLIVLFLICLLHGKMLCSGIFWNCVEKGWRLVLKNCV
jgi:hypothetical protein